MENKKLIYIVGGIAVIGLGYYLYNKNKKPINVGAPIRGGAKQGEPSSENEDKVESEVKKTEEGKTSTPTSTPPPQKLSKKQARKQRRKDSKTYMAVCGKKPLLKKNRPAWQQCVDEQKKGGSAFDGASNYFEIQSNMSGNLTDNMDIF